MFTEVVDYGQWKMSTTWVISEKLCNGSKVTKARLVARGFEEEDLNTLKTDSPTCSKESLRLIMAISSAYNWVCHSLDIKAAFLQGNSIEREVFLKPPPEANAKGIAWKLNKCVYGLVDASHSWYFRVKEEL